MSSLFLHFHTLHLHTPRVGGLVKCGLHVVRDLLPLRQNLGEALGSNNIPEKKITWVIFIIILCDDLSVVAARR